MTPLVSRDDIVHWLDDYLRVREIDDASPNGLQVEGNAAVPRVAFAVDASVQTIEAAARQGAAMLIVHHGLWWGKHEQIVGNMRKRIAALVGADMSLYAAHLPLDCHPEVGNNVELARLIGATVEGTFAEYHGTRIGALASLPSALTRERFVSTVEEALKVKPDVLAFGPSKIRRVAIISGDGGRAAEEARREGCDALLTGETSHTAFHTAREAGINLIFAGHYATETVGLKALDRKLRKSFNVQSKFVSAPTGY